MVDLSALRELYAWMRAEAIPYARCGDLELRLNPPSPPASGDEDPPLSEAEVERRTLETLLFSSGASVDPFLTRQK